MRISSTLTNAMKVAASGLNVERFRMDVISSNIANASSTGLKGQPPYRRRDVVIAGGPNGVAVTGIREDQKPFRIEYDPSNPNADKDGNVLYTNIEPIQEMVDMIGASRAYEANIASFNSAKGMIRSALNIGKV